MQDSNPVHIFNIRLL